ATLIDLLDDLEICDRIRDIATGMPPIFDRVSKIAKLCAPRSVREWIFPACRLRRSHLREHPIIRQALYSIASAEPVHDQLSIARHELEREEILPLGPGRVKPSQLAVGGAQGQEAIVIDRRIPEIRRHGRVLKRQVTEEPACQIDEVGSLIDQLAA